MGRPCKFRPGALLYTLASFAYHLEEGRHFFFRGKFQHNGWARGWQLGAAMTWITAGYLREARPTEVTQ